MKNIGKIILGTALFLAAATVVGYASIQVKHLKDYCLRLITAKNFSAKKGEGVKVTLVLGFKNKSEISAELLRQEYTVKINDMEVARIKDKLQKEGKPLFVAAEGETPIEVAVTILPDKLKDAGVNNIEALLFDKSKISIRLKGFIRAKAGIISTNVPVDAVWTLKELLTPSNEPSSC